MLRLSLQRRGSSSTRFGSGETPHGTIHIVKRGFTPLVVFAALSVWAIFAMSSGSVRAAEVEFCPARLEQFYAFDGARDGLVAFYVAAESVRTVSANVIVEGENGSITQNPCMSSYRRASGSSDGGFTMRHRSETWGLDGTSEETLRASRHPKATQKSHP